MRKYGGGAPCRPYCRRAVVKFRCSISSGGGSRSGGGGGDRQRNGAARRTLLLGGAGGALVAAGGAQHRGSLLNPWPALAADGGGDADLASAASARRLERALERRVTRFQLANGMTFVVAERPAGSAPIFAASTYVNAGAWQERDGRGGEAGETGAAHLLEHLAFKGTPRVGSRDWRREGALLRAVDEGARGRAREGAGGGLEIGRHNSTCARTRGSVRMSRASSHSPNALTLLPCSPPSLAPQRQRSTRCATRGARGASRRLPGSRLSLTRCR